jgi:hypothetical protein
MQNSKNVLLVEGVLISALVGAYKSFSLIALCMLLILGLTVAKTKFWIMLFTTIFTTLWGLIGFFAGNYFHSLSIELVLTTLCLALATGFNMVYLYSNEVTTFDKIRGKSRDC